MESKEEDVLGLFFDYPSKEWHFEEILQAAKITRGKADGWLKKFIEQGIIQKTKIKGKMPYYTSNHNSPSYKNKKRIYALNMLYESGFLNHLLSLPKAEAVILFGSFGRSDWYKKSDIDVFIYGNPEGLKITDFELKLHREIQIFICQNPKELEKLGPGLLKNIIRGNFIKGNIDFKVEANA